MKDNLLRRPPRGGDWYMAMSYPLRHVMLSEKLQISSTRTRITGILKHDCITGSVVVNVRNPHNGPLIQIGFDASGIPDVVIIDPSIDVEISSAKVIGNEIVVELKKGIICDCEVSADYEYKMEIEESRDFLLRELYSALNEISKKSKARLPEKNLDLLVVTDMFLKECDEGS